MAADGLVNRGNTFKEMGRVSEAIQDYIKAVVIRPTMAEAHANLASAYKDRYIFWVVCASQIFSFMVHYLFIYKFLQWTCRRSSKKLQTSPASASRFSRSNLQPSTYLTGSMRSLLVCDTGLF